MSLDTFVTRLKSIEEAIMTSLVNHNVLLGRKAELESTIQTIKEGAATVEKVATDAETVVDAIPAPAESVAS